MPPTSAGTKNNRPRQWLNSGVPGARVQQLQQRRPQDQRQHQQFVRIERKANRGDDANRPLNGVSR